MIERRIEARQRHRSHVRAWSASCGARRVGENKAKPAAKGLRRGQNRIVRPSRPPQYLPAPSDATAGLFQSRIVPKNIYTTGRRINCKGRPRRTHCGPEQRRPWRPERRPDVTDTQILTIAIAVVVPLALLIYLNSRLGRL
jgi:hypothetical protein